jgi:photosystem II stability/assembly factor-like uncharacterized protein
MSFNNSDSIIFALGNNAIYKSTNHGLNWSSVLSGQLRSVEVSPDNPNIVYAGSTAGLHRSTNGGQSWFLYNDSFTPSKIVIGISKMPHPQTLFMQQQQMLFIRFMAAGLE